eukprot:49393-Prymnesium_polylepis.1
MGEREERAVALFADWVRSDGRLIFTGRLGNVRRPRHPHSRPRPPQGSGRRLTFDTCAWCLPAHAPRQAISHFCHVRHVNARLLAHGR